MPFPDLKLRILILICQIPSDINVDTGEASGFDPQLIVDLAAEIERLKSDLEDAKVKLKAASASKAPRTASSQSSSSATLH